ncbi:DNA modification methylase [Thermanaeromonas toyohensis ToBE]|uniref:DNA modification methylase n=1 Tax=Thermanaeromonas toyohensis ToBE TaxID=698762 RepID=A0A1W1VSC1_9FIRM|nr:DNA methyltransferase [Thermanaeromonas toyohensis]SMB96257.1 DNA modification methylase [Thermanaeromonas toyohensis ToBE]
MEKKCELVDLPVALLRHSRFNTRKTREAADIQMLAERIRRIGYERTRAVWAVPVGNHYEVFAGGTRLEAAKVAGLDTMPVLVHYGYTDEEISRLSDLDNENDEYHRPVPITDVWAEYARLHEEEGWSQKKIAAAKGVAESLVSERIAWHKLPDKVKKLVLSGDLTEAHLRRIWGVILPVEFTLWLTTEMARLELAEKVVYDKKKNGEKSVRALEADVAAWKEWINYAEKVYGSLEEELTLYDFSVDPPRPYLYKPREEFVRELAKRRARSMAAVREAELVIKRMVADNLEQYRKYLEEKSAKAALEKAKAEKVTEIVSGFKQGDARSLVGELPEESVRLLLTDPPYGMEYRSNRRWASQAPEVIRNDRQEEAFALLEEVIKASLPKLQKDAHVLVFCSWRGEPKVREILENAGLTVKGSLVWVKEEHSAGDVRGAFAPRHERIIHAVKGSPEVSPRKPDVFYVPRAKRELHPAEKPVELLKQLIECTTAEGDLVLDPFAGVASTCVAALELGRVFVGFEIDGEYYEKGRERLYRVAQEKVEEIVRLQPPAA